MCIRDREREYLDTLERNLFDGLIVGSAFLSDEYYMNIEKPIISLDRIIPGIPMVTSDHHQGGILAGELFLEKGCKMCIRDSPFFDNTILPYIISKIYSRNLIYSILVIHSVYM